MARVAPLDAASVMEDAVSDAATLLRHALTLDVAADRAALMDALDHIAMATEDQRQQLSDTLALAASRINLHAVVHAFSPKELCVLLSSLDHVSSHLASNAAAQLASVRAAIETTIHSAMASTGRHELAVALHGDAASLRSLVMDGMAAKRDIQQVGYALAAMFSQVSVSFSNDTCEALRRMAEWGAPLSVVAVDELRNTNALVLGAIQLSKHELLQLREAVGRAAACGVSLELMHLWALVHSSISSILPVESLADLASDTLDIAKPVVSETQAIGELLRLALVSSMSLASAVSIELQDAIKNMGDRGMPLSLAVHLREELHANAERIAQALSPDKLVQLQTHLREVASAEWEDAAAFLSTLQHAMASLPPVQTVVLDAAKHTAADLVYSNAFSVALRSSHLDEKLDRVMLATRDGVHEAMAALTMGVSSTHSCLVAVLATLPPLLRVEILRDFCQTVGLFFTNLYSSMLRYTNVPWLRDTQRFFQSAFNIVSVDLTALWSDKHELLIDIGFGVLLGTIALTYGAYLWFAISGRHLHKRSEEIRHGHEATTWAELAIKQQRQLRAFTIVITLCLTMYLPLTRVCLEILVAAIVESSPSSSSASNIADLVSPSTLRNLERYSDLRVLWVVLRIAAVALLVTFTVPLPVLLLRAISENKPAGSLENPLVTYDVDGEQVAFDDKVYARLVASDPSQLQCPYRSLYAGFEQKWSHYKVCQLIFKTALIVPLLVTRQRGIRSIITSVLYSGIVALTSYGTPFNDPLNNVMELSGKGAALVTCVGGVVLAFLQDNDRVQVLVGVLVNVVNAVNMVVMVGILLFGMPRARLWIKNRLGTLTFSDTVRDIQDAPAASIVPHWDLDKEIKHRIWHHFWHTVLLSLPENKEIIQRLASLQHAVTQSGVANVARHWQGHATPYIASMRLAARRLLEGVDVFWDDASGARDGFLDSKSCFGKMYIRPYPFHCVVVYDDCADESIVRDDKFPAFFFLNFSPAVVARRLVRQKLRALSDGDVEIHFPFARQETVTVEDGTETTTSTNAEGKTETTTRTRYTSVSFTCYYTVGVIRIAANSDKHEMAAGFHFTMTYRDGRGDAVAPHTGQVHHQENRVAVMGQDHVGLTCEMQESAQLAAIFQQTHARWSIGVERIQERANEYRRQLMEHHAAANRVLGDGFWYFVFNNPTLPRHQLCRYLAMEETNPVLKRLPETHGDALDFLYQRMGFVLSHPACSLWYVFWDDVFARNGEMTRLKPFERDLNPARPTSQAYRVLRRDELTTWLKEKQLFGRPLSWYTVLLGRRCLFHERILQLLFERMQTLLEPNDVPLKRSK